MKASIAVQAGVVAALLSSAAVAADQATPPSSRQEQRVEFINSGRFADYPFSDAVRVGNLTYFSGQIGNDASAKIVAGGIKAEAKQVMENIKASVEANGYKMSQIVKCTAFLADIADWPAFNAIYRSYFSKPYPARSALGTSGLALGARVEVECIAAK